MRTRRLLGLAAALGLVHLWTRVAPLRMSLAHDEAFTIVNFVAGGPAGIYLEPYSANNHVLFNLLTWATTRVLGASEPVYRLWSVLPAVAAVALLCWWVWRRLSPAAALGLGVLVTVAPLLARHTSMARGYGLALLACVAMLMLSVRLLDDGDRRSLLGLGVVGVAGFWAYPLTAPVFAGHLAAVFVLRPHARRRVAEVALGTAVAAVVVMGPVLPGLARNAAHLTGVPNAVGAGDGVTGEGLVAAAPATGVLRQFLPGVPRTTPGGVAAGALGVFALLGAWGLARLPAPVRAAVLAPVVTLLSFHLLTGVHFAPRFLITVLPHLLLPVAVGLAELRAVVLRQGSAVNTGAAAGALALTALLLAQGVRAAEELTRVPLQEARAVASTLDREAVAAALTDHDDPVALAYYTSVPVRPQRSEALRRRSCGPQPPAAVVLYDPDEAVDACLRARGASVRAFPQQWGAAPTLYLIEDRAVPAGRARPVDTGTDEAAVRMRGATASSSGGSAAQ